MPSKHRGKRVTTRPAPSVSSATEDEEPKAEGKKTPVIKPTKAAIPLLKMPSIKEADIQFILGTISVSIAVYLILINSSTLMQIRPQATQVCWQEFDALIDWLISF